MPLDPATVRERLRRAGFADTAVDVGDYQILLRAQKRAGLDRLPDAPPRGRSPRSALER